MKLKAFAAAAIAALVLGNAAPSHAQAPSGTAPTDVVQSPEGVGDTSDTYGASDTAYVVGAYDFEAYSSASTFSGSSYGDRFFTSAGGFFQAPVNLPNGAVITRIEIQGCDTNAGSNLAGLLYSGTTISGTQSQILHGALSTSGTPGCGFFSANFGTPATVTNQTRTYFIEVSFGAATDGSVRFSAVRLFYHLQVSPAPATATFPNDVPTTHPFFRFVEAMAASGLTGGCSAGSFCPNDPVTRGQLSVFLAVALGLHFPN
jgi:hypothetical protein